MTIELTERLFYKGGASGNFSQIVGNDYENGAVISRVVRYTFTAPEIGANHVNLTFHISGKESGDAIPLRFYINTDPKSHADAGSESEYTGELVLANDWLSLSGEADVLLLPGQIYYLWVFPANETYGCYKWYRSGYTSQLEPTGAACLAYVRQGGELYIGLMYVVYEGALWLCAGYVVKGGALYLCGAATGGASMFVEANLVDGLLILSDSSGSTITPTLSESGLLTWPGVAANVDENGMFTFSKEV